MQGPSPLWTHLLLAPRSRRSSWASPRDHAATARKSWPRLNRPAPKRWFDPYTYPAPLFDAGRQPWSLAAKSRCWEPDEAWLADRSSPQTDNHDVPVSATPRGSGRRIRPSWMLGDPRRPPNES